MRYPNGTFEFLVAQRTAVVLSMVFLIFAMSSAAQDLPPTVAHVQSIPAGSYVIPMDNVLQGNAGGTTFNLQAYGLANKLLQNGIPLLWAIKSGKAQDAVDFTAAASRIVPSAQASASRNFSGGPFIVHPSYNAAALPIINAYGNSVAVYQLTNATLVDVRYTLTHKPLIAVGLANGTYSQIHKDVFIAAGIPNYIDYNDATVNADSCVTLIAQPHVDGTATTNVPGYRLFALSGGNVLFQCRAIETYENNASGHFQTSLGWTINNLTSTSLSYPSGDMPFSQFIGGIDGSQSGYETDYRLTTGSLVNGAFINVENTGNNVGTHVATTSKVYNAGPGGMVFELGGHDYRSNGSTIIGDINGQRMLLNAVFVPPTRPAVCGITIGTPLVEGYKSVQLTNNVAPFNIGAGDELTWTIDYINRGSAVTTNFQISDPIFPANTGKLTLVGTPTVTVSGAGTAASANGSFTGTSPNQGLLASGATLGVNGRITVKVKTTINVGFTSGEIANQTSGTGDSSPTVMSDNIDSSVTITYPGIPSITAPGSIDQILQPTLDPASVFIFVPTAASATIDGQVRTADGLGIGRATVTVTNPSSGEVKTAITNPFGYYTVTDLPAGDFYVISISDKRYRFANPTVAFTLNDSVSGVVFVAEGNSSPRPGTGVTKGSPAAVANPETKLTVKRSILYKQ